MREAPGPGCRGRSPGAVSKRRDPHEESDERFQSLVIVPARIGAVIRFLARLPAGYHARIPLSPDSRAIQEVFVGTVDQTMMKVQRILTGPMGLRVSLQGNTMNVTFTDISTRVSVSVQDWGVDKNGDPQTLVRLSSPVLWEVEPTPDVYKWIAREGGNYFFGHITAHDDSDAPGKLFLLMSHTLLGDYLDEEELSSAMWGVLTTADKLDDELKQKFGGKRLSDFA
jgi:hypothetical protein